MTKAKYIFRVKHDVQNDSELSLAKLELRGTFPGVEIKEVTNLVDILCEEPLASLLKAPGARFQDVFLRLPYTGAIQGYVVEDELRNVESLIDRLCYFRDFFVVVQESDATRNYSRLVSSSDRSFTPSRSESVKFLTLNPHTQVFLRAGNLPITIFRFVPIHLFLEASDHVGRLAMRPEDVERMFKSVSRHFVANFKRPYSASSSRGFKWIEDFVDDRRAPSAYSSHSFFGLRGKFFPRMVHALLNYLDAKPTDKILDPFCGVGTLGVEASLMGLNTVNSDINPFFKLVGQIKCDALHLDSNTLRQQVEELLDAIQSEVPGKAPKESLSLDFSSNGDTPEIKIPPALMKNVQDTSIATMELILARISEFDDPAFRNFAKIPLAYYAKSMLRKYTPQKIVRAYWGHLWRMLYVVQYQSRVLEKIRPLKLGRACFENWDIRNLSHHIRDVDLIVTSPPYTTAIDYVGNDAHAMYVVGATTDHAAIDAQTIGTTKLGRKDYTAHIVNATPEFKQIPEKAQQTLQVLYNGSTAATRKASALLKYYWDMSTAFLQMKNALREGGRLAMIIGTEQSVTVNRRRHVLKVADSIADLGQRYFTLVERYDIELAKTTAGGVYSETILLFKR